MKFLLDIYLPRVHGSTIIQVKIRPYRKVKVRVDNRIRHRLDMPTRSHILNQIWAQARQYEDA